MTSTQTVVVGMSGAPADDAALDWAVEECRTTASRLVIAHACSHGVADEEPALPGHPGLVTAIDEARRQLGDDRVSVHVQAPPSGAMLLTLVTDTDLLVVGPPSRGRWTHWGSTSQYLTRHATCPVVVARPTAAAGPGPFHGHVVVGVDGSAAAREALGFGFAYADSHGLPLVAVTVSDENGHVWYDDQLLEAHLTTEPAALSALAAQLEPSEYDYPHVWAKRAVFAGARPIDGLLRAAEGARLLVVGAHSGRSGRRILLGSTSLDAISRATCPVAVLQPPPLSSEQLPTPKEVHHVRT